MSWQLAGASELADGDVIALPGWLRGSLCLIKVSDEGSYVALWPEGKRYDGTAITLPKGCQVLRWEGE